MSMDLGKLMTEPVPPPLGDHDIDPKRTCTRLIGRSVSGNSQLCDEPAAYHVDWGSYAGFVCAGHLGEVGTRWESNGGHDLGSDCGMPGVSWFDRPDGSSYCAYDGDVPTTWQSGEAVWTVPLGVAS